ncbi:ABC transporter permease [Candidatus Amarolinea dominans]|uniref:ABC transporter permease n=1 Tax=Candidatus Amarolinea dominans TaxID=3140696 RepID=UPI001E01135D|nr:ABC transporter permease [Anaerolineae bacterium]
MKKLILIGLKDVKLIFRDRAALTFMLLAPFLLTIGLGFVTGQMGRSSTGGLAAIPVLVVNQDDGQLGQALADLLRSEDLAGLLLPTLAADATGARGQVDADQAAAAVIVPAGFSDSIIPRSGQTPSGQAVKIEVYKNPGRPVSAGVIQAIVEGFISRVETGRVAGQVIVVQALTAGLIAPDQAQDFAVAVGQRQTAASAAEPLIRLQFSASGEEQQPFNPMAYMAPSMALLFLMFTVTNGGRSLLAEKAQGTLARLLISPTTGAQALLGKLFGAYLTGVLQMLILILTGSLLFGLRWGDPLGLLVLILAAVFGALGWGMLITALAQTPGQVSAVGTAVMLTFGILGGSFVQTNIMPSWFQWLSRVTPNAWGLDGFTILGLGGTLADLGRPLLGLLVMGLVLAAAAIALFNRRSLLQA